MFEDIPPDEIVTQILFIRQTIKSAIVLVEGENDILFWERYCSDKDVRLLPAWNKVNALSAIELAEKDGIGGILAIVDADFDHILKKIPDSTNIVLTDVHDIEIQITLSPALENVLREMASPEKIRSSLSECRIDNCRELLFHASHPIGALRYLSDQKGWQLDFNGIDYKGSYESNFTIDVARLFESVISRTVGKSRDATYRLLISSIDRSKVMEQVSSILADSTILLSQICCGDDIVNIISFALRKIWGSLTKLECDTSKIRSAMRLAYDSAYLLSTNMYRNIREWETNNSKFRILNL